MRYNRYYRPKSPDRDSVTSDSSRSYTRWVILSWVIDSCNVLMSYANANILYNLCDIPHLEDQNW